MADWRILKTRWIVDQLWIFWRGFWIVPVLMFGSSVLNEIWIINLSSALVGRLMSSSKLFLFSNDKWRLFNLRYETVNEIVLCYSHSMSPSLLCGRNWQWHNPCQFTFKPLHLFFRMWLWSRIWTIILAHRRIWRKKGTDRRICILLFTPVLYR